MFDCRYKQKIVRVEYKGLVFDEPLRFDLLVDDCLLVELKAVEVLRASSKAQLFSYMKLLDIPIGLLINFSRADSEEWDCPHDFARSQRHRRQPVLAVGLILKNLRFLSCLL